MINMLGSFHKEAARFRLVGQVGLEPTMGNPADLQSAAIAARRLTRIFHLLQSGFARAIISSEYWNLYRLCGLK